MKQILINLLLITLCFSEKVATPPTTSTTTASTNGNLTGKYINAAGSVMELTCTGSGGAAVLSGVYTSLDKEFEGSYVLSGHATSCGNTAQGAFAVAWVNEQSGNSFSASSWTFQAQQDGPRIILNAYWMAVHETTQEDAWTANNFGLDIFTKQDNNGHVIERSTPSTISK